MGAMRLKCLRNILLGAFVLVVSGHVDDAAAGGRNVLFMLDSSGSMWAQIKQENRVVIARDALNAVLPRYRRAFPFGIASFGHRRAANCGRVESLVPIGPIDPAAIRQKLNATNPSGAASVAASLTKGAGLLEAGVKPATMILLADGPDNCGAEPDPCAVARELARTSPDFRIHVIAFASLKVDRPKLSCIARATGGRFFTAVDRPQLMQAMEQAFAAARADVVRSDGQAGSIVTGSLKEEDEPVRPREKPAGPPPVPLVKPPPPAFLADREPPQGAVAAAPDQGDAGDAAKPASGADTGAVDGPASPDAGGGATALEAEKMARLEDAVRRPTPSAVIAPEFIVEERAGEKSGLRLRARITRKLAPIERPVDWSVFRIDPQQRNKWIQVAAQQSADAAFPLAPGEYVVRAAYGHAMAAKIITVRPNRLSDATFVLNAGAIRVRTTLVSLEIPPGRAAVQKIYAEGDLAAGRKPLATLVGKNDIIRLNAGAYEIVSQYGSANATVKTRVTIRPGRLTEVEINHKAGIARFRLTGAKAGAHAAKARWRLADAKGDTVAEADGKTMPADILAPGRYTVTAQIAGRTYRSDFDIIAGQAKDVAIEIR